jgi:hypothetical protein
MAQSRLLLDQVDRIVRLDAQPVLRNLLITQCYHDLSRELGRVLGSSNVNWCTFATWASKTAGRFIRNDEIPALFRKLLEDSRGFRSGHARLSAGLFNLHPETTLSEFGLFGVADRIVLDVSGQITAGNLKVFSELAPVFARFVRLFDGGTLDERGADRLMGSLRSGSSSRDGQAMLREAIENFLDAARESDPRKKAQHMLIANAQTGLHEQIRLQPYIAGSLNAPIEETLGRIWEREGAPPPEKHSLLDRVAALWDRLGAALVHDAEKAWGMFSAEELMTLAVPGQVLRLGATLPPVRSGRPLYPEQLRQIQNEAAHDLLLQYDALDPHEQGEVGADDWSALAQRMRYILALFRSRQQEASMLQQPFTDAQMAAILADHVPDGPLS